MLTIYHNPRCTKSRQTLELIEKSGSKSQVVEYLKTPPSKEELRDIVKKLDIKPEELVRKNERIFKDKFKGKKFSDDQWLEILADNPKLIERPIVVMAGRAIIGRPPEAVKELL
jgi:arsenate reductase